MKNIYWLFLLLPAALIIAFTRDGAGERLSGDPGDKGSGFAVVELFTSEGCSSCPPADALLARVAAEHTANVIVLGYHVDYWDRLGWKDIYSNADYTRRQQEYAQHFNLNSIYTPEIVVNGKKEFVGSDESKLRAAIGEELRKDQPGGDADALLKLGAAAVEGKKIHVPYTLKNPGGKLRLQLALVQWKALSQVKSGENEGKSLTHISVVRDLKTLSVDGKNSGSGELSLPAGLVPKDCKVVAFLQDTNNGHIIAVAEVATLL